LKNFKFPHVFNIKLQITDDPTVRVAQSWMWNITTYTAYEIYN